MDGRSLDALRGGLHHASEVVVVPVGARSSKATTYRDRALSKHVEVELPASSFLRRVIGVPSK